MIKVTPEQLTSLGGRVGTGSNHIGDELQALRSALAPLGSDWAGNAQAQFQALWAEWDSAARNLQHALTGISTLLTGAGTHFGDADAAIGRTFARR